MKRIFLFFTALHFASAISAQNLSGGIRAGIESWMHLDGSFHGTGKYLTFTKEAFIRAQARKHWSVELNVAQSFHDFGTKSAYITDEWSGMQYWAYSDAKENRFDVNLNVAYEISCPCCSSRCNRQPFWKNYIGLTAGPSILTENKTGNTSGVYPDYEKTIGLTELWTGLTNTIVVSVNKHLSISGHFSWKVNLSEPIFSSFPSSTIDSRFLGALGIGYQF